MPKDEDPIIANCSRIASALSLITIISSGILYTLVAQDLETFSDEYRLNVQDLRHIHMESSNMLLENDKMRIARQSFYPQRRNNGFNYRTTANDDDFPRSRWNQRSNSPKICDCTVVQCPRGPRGPQGSNGDPAEDGIPGEPGRNGMDGIFLVEEAVCPPCPHGARGPDGTPGEKGEQGKSGPPGVAGRDGVNEPGPAGEPGNRGQTGRAGKKGIDGEPGQDAVQLTGTPGAKGPDGPPGHPGARGDPGNNGIPAPPGAEGPPGPEGEPGEPGEYGPRGPPGRKGAPGQDGGYCQCPPREGAGIAVSSGSDSLPLTWEEYRSGSIRTAALPDVPRNYHRESPKEIPRQQTNRRPPAFHNQEADRYPEPIERFIEVGERKMSHSPMAPLVAYRDSREQGVKNRVILSRRPATQVKGSVDFDFKH